MSNKPSLLVVDDETEILNTLHDTFADMYNVYKATSASEALEVLKKHKIDLVISDQRMPDKTGTELFIEMEQSYPEIGKVLLTGYADINSMETAINNGYVDKYITKPWKEDRIVHIVLEVLNTRLKKSIEQQRKMKEYATKLINYSLDMIVTSDKDRCIVEFNKAAEDTFGYKKDEVIGKNIKMLYASEEESKSVLALIQKEGRFYSEVMNKRKNGEIFPSRVSISVIKDDHGKVEGFMGVSRDITQQRSVDAELQVAIKKAEFANKAKDEFLANMSHEIRTPLNGIIGISELVLDKDLDVALMNYMQTLNIEAVFLLNIINNILDFSKIEAGKFELEEIDFDLRTMLDDVQESFKFKTEQKKLEFNCIMPSDVPSLLIGDPTRLRQVIVNLVNNALKFTHEGGISINVNPVEDLENKIKLRFQIKDTGIGIPADKQDKIFEKFVQADSSVSKKYGGTGLGIALCKQFVGLMDGSLNLESEEGKGSTFEFTAVFAKQKVQEPGKTKDHDLIGKRVLVVDDSETNRHELGATLKPYGCQVQEASEGEEALIILQESVSYGNPFDVIIINYKLSDMDSVALVKAIRDIKLLKEVPCVMLTDVGEVGDAKACKDIGVQGYLTMPIRRDYLRRTIGSAIFPATGEYQKDQPLITKHTIAEEKSIRDIRILLVEDYPTNQMIAIRFLQNAGYKVDLAENGIQAVDMYKKKHYDLVFMDLQMPEMDGFGATKGIRAHESGLTGKTHQTVVNCPIIAMTAHATVEIKDRCLNSGMDDFVSKPVRRNALLTIVEKWLKKIADSQQEIGPEKVITLDAEPEKTSDEGLSVTADLSSPTKLEEKTKTDDHTRSDTPIDFDICLKEFNEDKEFLIEVVEGFLDDVRIQIKVINQAVSDGTSDRVRRDANSIKGRAANLTANNLSSIAAELEAIGKSGNLKNGPEILERLQEEFNRIEDFIKVVG